MMILYRWGRSARIVHLYKAVVVVVTKFGAERARGISFFFLFLAHSSP